MTTSEGSCFSAPRNRIPAPPPFSGMNSRVHGVLGRTFDGDADLEDGGDAEPSLAAPENTAGSQVVYMRGSDQDREEAAPETVLPEVAAEAMEAVVLPWHGRGNVIAAAGTLLIDLLERA